MASVLQKLYGELHHRRAQPDDIEPMRLLDEVHPTPTGLQRAFLVQLPRLDGTSSDMDACSICLKEDLHHTLLTQLPCDHTFCTCCIQRWLSEKKDQCPLCKATVRDGGRIPDESLCSNGDSSELPAKHRS